jgi:hypothetical protein
MRIRAIAAVAVCLVGAAAWAGEGAPPEKSRAESPAKGAAPPETPRTAKFGGVSLGMSVAELSWTLESQGYRADPKRKRNYIDDSGEVKRNIRYLELPVADGTLTVYELDETAWYPPAKFDAKAFEADIHKRFGEPYQVKDVSVGRREITYRQKGPSVVEVIEACQKEIQAKDPKLSAADAEKRASAVAQYRAINDDVEKTCPGALPLYRKMADALEAPRLTFVVRSARVDSMLRWDWVEAELNRRLGPEQAARVIALGPDAVKPAEPAPKP